MSSAELVLVESRQLDIEHARELIARCKSTDEAKEIRDRALAVATYLRVKKASTEARDDAFEVALRAERRMGQLLAEQVPHRGGRPKANGREQRPFLREMGVTKDESSRAQKLAAIPEQEFDGRIKVTRERSEKLTVKSILSTTAATDHDGDSWMTPPEFIEKARRVLGGIDLDPASSEEAQRVVRASRFFTKLDDGLAQEWAGRVWLNPPFSHPLVEQFSSKLASSFAMGSVASAILLVNSATDTAWFQALLAKQPTCFTRGRISFVLPGGGAIDGNRQGQAFFFFGCDSVRARREFGSVGTIVRALQ